jgi:uridine monophosphate synthetase
LKSGEKTDTYLDIRAVISTPKVLSLLTQAIACLIHEHVPDTSEFTLCGVPYGALPFATALSLNMNVPLIVLRETRKKYGLKNIIVGAETVSRNIILIEDVITTGRSVLDAIGKLHKEGYTVKIVISIVLRDQDKVLNALKDFIPYSFLFTMDELLRQSLQEYDSHLDPRPRMWREEIKRKKTNIVLAYDKPDVRGLFKLLNQVKNKIIGLKIHSEILDLTHKEELELVTFCRANRIFLWEDRKMNDIAAIAEKQMKKYENTRDFISIAPTSGPHLLGVRSSLGFFVVVEMSSADNCFSGQLSAKIASFIDQFPCNVCGIICQDDLWFGLPFLSIKPGISKDAKSDDMGQQYSGIEGKQPDLFVIGRAITDSDEPELTINYFLK